VEREEEREDTVESGKSGADVVGTQVRPSQGTNGKILVSVQWPGEGGGTGGGETGK